MVNVSAVDVGEHRRQVVPDRRVDGAAEGVGRDDDLALQPVHVQHDGQRRLAVAERQRVRHTQIGGHPLLELDDEPGVVGDLSALQRGAEVRLEGGQLRQHGTDDVADLVERWSRSEYGGHPLLLSFCIQLRRS